jgi:hypothetical protein
MPTSLCSLALPQLTEANPFGYVGQADGGGSGQVKHNRGRSWLFQVVKGIPVPIVYTCPVRVAIHDAWIVSGNLVFSNN